MNKADASTETPTHFIETNIDPKHSWNDSNQNINFLKLLQLTKCKTTSQQTINSHFRRENFSQVYLPKNNDSQTRRDKGSNHAQVTTYMTSVENKYVKSHEKTKNHTHVVTLTLDL
jgi:hypothetical protein